MKHQFGSYSLALNKKEKISSWLLCLKVLLKGDHYTDRNTYIYIYIYDE